uniref:PCRF domain-containing protein n=1 Tax=Ascaris lumbricoides TaxID=6252 RepID=A0A0M3IUP6_ASCLU
MHRDAFRYLQESQNELLESMEKMRNGVKLDCENKLKTLEEVRAQMRDVKEPSFAPQIYAELIESLRICESVELSIESENKVGMDLADNSCAVIRCKTHAP